MHIQQVGSCIINDKAINKTVLIINECLYSYLPIADAYIEEETRTVSTISKPYKQMKGAGLHLPDGVWAHKGVVAPYHNGSGHFIFYILVNFLLILTYQPQQTKVGNIEAL